jgi:hypothetical protein
MANCAVQHEVIVITCHSPFSSSFGSHFLLGLRELLRAEVLVALANPTEYSKYVKYVIYDIFKYKANILIENVLFETRAKMSLQLWIDSCRMKNDILEHCLGLNWHDKLPETAGRQKQTTHISLRTGSLSLDNISSSSSLVSAKYAADLRMIMQSLCPVKG